MSSPKQPALRLRDRRRRLMWMKVSAGSAVVAVALALLWYAARLPEVTIGEVAVEGTKLAKAELIHQLSEDALQGSYAFLFPKSNALFVPRGNIASAIYGAFPQVENVSIVRDGWQKLVISITEKVPIALWCSGSDTCYLMNEQGFVFDTAGSDEPYVRFFGRISNEPIGQTYLGGEFSALNDFVTAVSEAAAGRTPAEVLVEDNDDVSVTFLEGGVLKFVRTADKKETIDDIASVFASRRFNTEEKLEYADFRFGNKVYVKFRGE